MRRGHTAGAVTPNADRRELPSYIHYRIFIKLELLDILLYRTCLRAIKKLVELTRAVRFYKV
jgi:hypothetical protein